MNQLTFRLSLAMAFLCMGFSEAAWAACSSPAGVLGSYKYVSAERRVYKCDGTNWVVDTAGAPNLLNGIPVVGAGGSNVVNLCGGAIGSRCGGGFYIGDGNLVATGAGCSGTTCPTETVGGVTQAPYAGRDTYYNRYETSNSPTTMSSQRYGYATNQSNNNSNYPAFQYCRNLSFSVGGVTYSDWYVPTLYETELFVQSLSDIGGSYYNGYNINYMSASEAYNGQRFHHVTAYHYLVRPGDPTSTGGQSNIDTKDQNYAIRCVRRN